MDDILDQGYGKIPKIIVCDPRIPIDSKSVLSIMCSYVNKDSAVAYPSRDHLLHTSGVVSNTYYKYLHILIEKDLLSITSNRSDGNGRFSHNQYRLVPYPEFYRLPFPNATAKMTEAIRKVQLAQNVFAAGFGIVPKVVMADERISLGAKAVYAYHSAFASNGNISFPKQKDLLYHLQISSGTYGKYCRELEKAGYIMRHPRRENGMIIGTEILLVGRDPYCPITPEAIISDTVKSDVVKSDAVKSDAAESATAISDSNTNSCLTNIEPTLSALNQSRSDTSEKKRFTSSVPIDSEEPITLERVESEMLAAWGLPFEYCSQPDKLCLAIVLLTQDDAIDLAGEDKDRYQLFVRSLADMLNSNTPPLKIRGSVFSHGKVYEALCPYIKVNDIDDSVRADGLFANVNALYKKNRELTRIEHPFPYMKSMIMTWLQTGEIRDADIVAYDFSPLREQEHGIQTKHERKLYY